MALARGWPRWREVLCLVKPETVIAWHRGFPSLLAMAVARRRAAAYRRRDSSARPEDGYRQPLVGRTEDSR